MKWWIFLSLYSFPLIAKPVILVSYFDAFGVYKKNNSQTIALALAQANQENESYDIQLCELSTIYDKAYAQLEKCLKSMPTAPLMVLSLGESFCQLKIETSAQNWDKNTVGPDNAGIKRYGRKIIPEGDKYLGFTYPLDKMYCALKPEERSQLLVSSDAGSFVCNNTAYQMAHYYNEINYGFIHVPANDCENLETLNRISLNQLTKMLSFVAQNSEAVLTKLPTTRSEIKQLRREHQGTCIGEFYQKLPAPK